MGNVNILDRRPGAPRAYYDAPRSRKVFVNVFADGRTEVFGTLEEADAAGLKTRCSCITKPIDYTVPIPTATRERALQHLAAGGQIRVWPRNEREPAWKRELADFDLRHEDIVLPFDADYILCPEVP